MGAGVLGSSVGSVQGAFSAFSAFANTRRAGTADTRRGWAETRAAVGQRAAIMARNAKW